ncbi:hypothetical protein [Paenibacillus lautus]|uniref:hypothetical protein n=1 Tax=Paenibacillus lautus TaxID=1401 RepID=UPI003D2E8CDB
MNKNKKTSSFLIGSLFSTIGQESAGLGAEQRARTLAASTVNACFRRAESPPLAKSGGLIFHGRFDQMDSMQ